MDIFKRKKGGAAGERDRKKNEKNSENVICDTLEFEPDHNNSQNQTKEVTNDVTDFNITINDPTVRLPTNRLEFYQRIIQGPYRPILKLYPRTLQGKKQRSFQKSWYEMYSWLEYSPIVDAAFCFPCRCFNGNESNIGQTEQLSKRESERLNNREMMKRLIDIVICLAKCGKPFRGHDESHTSYQKGMFLELIQILYKYNTVLKTHIDSGPKNAIYTSNVIQNDIINSIHNVIIQELKLKLQNTHIAIMADETSDVGHHEQLSVVFRYFDTKTNRPIETFITLRRMLCVDAESIFNALDDVITCQFMLDWKNVIAVCFDGAATMAGNINGVQAKCKNKNKNILHVHCYAHCLNLTLMDAVCANAKYSEVNKCVFDFLGTVQFIYSFIEGSPIRHAVFERFAKLDGAKVQTLKSMSQTRWACRADAVNAVKNNYKALLCTLKEINLKCLIPEARAKCRGLLYQLKTFEFVYCLNLMQPILQLILKVSSSLQASNLELFTAVSLIHALRSSLNSLRNSPQEMQSIFLNTEQMYVLLSGIDDRFKQETSDLITVIGQLINLELNCNSSCIYILKNLLNIQTQDLFVEIKLLKSIEDTPKGTSSDYVYKWLDWLAIEGRYDTFRTFYNCLTYFVVIPVTSCGCERSFSKMSIVKTKLRSTMAQERLNALLFLFIEQEYVCDVNVESVIDDFKNVPTKRRLAL
ncbi:zinc finger MYM-type protein 1-like [Melanaphis sacchari]|uniref:zinc finger MYM-type protein 1-like n=1 Tax=Melanaphis sacchari TaxID=742174 RepID=UPI000DC141C9|nr:zinc finger MYM-type protein 1-like [Melanaphis sacchari]